MKKIKNLHRIEKNSSYVENFLDYLREVESQYNIAIMEQKEAELLTQDLLHKLELEDISHHEYAYLAKELKEIRKQRRIAKDTILCTSPIIQYARDNHKVIKQLEQLLGEVRKAEKSLENRHYTPKANRIGENP